MPPPPSEAAQAAAAARIQAQSRAKVHRRSTLALKDNQSFIVQELERVRYRSTASLGSVGAPNFSIEA